MGGSWGVQHPKCCQVQAAWEGSEQEGRAQQPGRLLQTPLLPAPASLLLPPRSPLCGPSPHGFSIKVGQSRSTGLALGGPSGALGSTPAPGPASKGYVTPPPPPCSPAGLCYTGGCWEAAHTRTRAELVCLGRFEHVFHFSPLSQLTPCKREQWRP